MRASTSLPRIDVAGEIAGANEAEIKGWRRRC